MKKLHKYKREDLESLVELKKRNIEYIQNVWKEKKSNKWKKKKKKNPPLPSMLWTSKTYLLVCVYSSNEKYAISVELGNWSCYLKIAFNSKTRRQPIWTLKS